MDFDYKQITVRDTKGGGARHTVLPEKLVKPLREHIKKVKKLHRRDLENGYGSVELPWHLNESIRTQLLSYPGSLSFRHQTYLQILDPEYDVDTTRVIG